MTTVYWVLIANCEKKQTSCTQILFKVLVSANTYCVLNINNLLPPGCNSRPIQLTTTYNSSVIGELQNDAQIKFDNENMIVAMESIKGGGQSIKQAAEPPGSLVGMTDPFSWQHCTIVASSENLKMMHESRSMGGSGDISTAIKPEEKFGYSRCE